MDKLLKAFVVFFYLLALYVLGTGLWFLAGPTGPSCRQDVATGVLLILVGGWGLFFSNVHELLDF